jgi:hypothetical protein
VPGKELAGQLPSVLQAKERRFGQQTSTKMLSMLLPRRMGRSSRGCLMFGVEPPPRHWRKKWVKVATAPVLRDAIAQQGVEVLGGADTLFPSGAEHGGWAEFGQIDAYGHAHPDEVNLVVTNDEHEGSAAMVVLIDSAGAILSQKTTSVGEKS